MKNIGSSVDDLYKNLQSIKFARWINLPVHSHLWSFEILTIGNNVVVKKNLQENQFDDKQRSAK